MPKKLLMNNCFNNNQNYLTPIMNGLVCWLEVDSYNGLIWTDKTSNGKNFTTPVAKNIVDNMIEFNRIPTDYFINNNINLDWNSCTIQIKLKDMIDYGDSAIFSLDGFDGFQLSTTNSLGRNKLRLNKYGGRIQLIKELELSNINNLITCIFSSDFIGIGIDAGSIEKYNAPEYGSSIFNKICIGNTTALDQGPFSAKIGTVLIYNRVLTEEEIKQNYLYEQSIKRG